MSNHETSAPSELELEIAHILLIDVVGYSQLLVNEQVELLQQLNQIVRSTTHFRRAESSGRLTRLPTGDGMALLFFNSPEEPAQCALEVGAATKTHPNIQLRMGVHSGPVNRVTDVNDQANVAGPGINLAQRVMDCGDAGHILLSKRIADDLSQYRHWKPYLHDLGECAVKHGQRLHIVNLCKDKLGNPNLPNKLRRSRRWQTPDAPSRFWPQIVAIAGCAAALIGAGAWFYFNRTGVFSKVPPIAVTAKIPEKSIAVLPFENLSNNQENAFFADGVQNEIMTDLARVADLKVISRTSVLQYKNTSARNIRDIAKELGVAYILEGSVQRFDHMVRVAAQLIDARTDAHQWAQNYDRGMEDVFAIETELAKQIVGQLKIKLSVKEQSDIEEQPTRDLNAYSLYLRASDLINAIAFTPLAKENLLEAVRLLEGAVQQDRAFARAYYELSRAHDLIYFLGIDHSPARLAMADSAIQSLIRRQPDSGEAHLAKAQHLYWGYGDYARSREELTLARKALPNEPLVLLLQGYIDRREGRWDESINEMEQALTLDPRNVLILKQISFNYSYLRRYGDQAEALDQVLAITPRDVGTRVQRAAVELDWKADLEPLRSTISSVIKEGPEAVEEAVNLWLVLAVDSRDPETAKQALAHISEEGTTQTGYLIPKTWWEGLVARALRDDAGAHAALTKARAEMQKIVGEQPDYAQPLSLLAMIDAGLGRKEHAVREGKRAVEMLPLSKDALAGTGLLENLATVYAWVGENQLACDQLETLTKIPSVVTYGDLLLSPSWDPLRGDPRFDNIAASLAPSP